MGKMGRSVGLMLVVLRVVLVGGVWSVGLMELIGRGGGLMVVVLMEGRLRG